MILKRRRNLNGHFKNKRFILTSRTNIFNQSLVLTDTFKDKNIDFHSFMSNPLEKQDLFLDILEEAEEEMQGRARRRRWKRS